jgi:hypothetical protein
VLFQADQCDQNEGKLGMTKVQILYWQEIPSVVETRDEYRVVKRQLSEQFQQLIDHIAMLRKLAGTDGYLEQWNKGASIEHAGDAETAAQEVMADLEARFGEIKSEAIAKSRG